jgi:hypothetical protein
VPRDPDRSQSWIWTYRNSNSWFFILPLFRSECNEIIFLVRGLAIEKRTYLIVMQLYFSLCSDMTLSRSVPERSQKAELVDHRARERETEGNGW